MRGISFSRIALAAMAASALVHLFHVFGLTAWAILAVNVLSLVLLSDRAVRYARAERPDFDAVIAAETIVAFGVMSLILGLTAGILPLFLPGNELDLGDPAVLKSLAMPFIIGLATAGFAPFAAMVLRNRAFEHEGAPDSGDEMEALYHAARELTRQIKAAQAALEELQGSARSAGASAKRLADGLDAETVRMGAALHEGEAHIKSFGAAAGSGRVEVSALADETRRLKGAASDTTTLLDALAKLIESVERFVAPSPGGR